MKLLIIIILSLLILGSCSSSNIKESPDDIASIGDEDLISDDPLISDNPNYDNTKQSDNEIASLEDDLLFKGVEDIQTITPEATVTKNKVAVDDQLIAPQPAEEKISETISMDDELVPAELSETTPTPDNQEVSGLMVLDNETQAWIPVNKCVHIIKNDLYTEPTCLKRR